MDMKGIIPRILPGAQDNADRLLRLIVDAAQKGDEQKLVTLIERYITAEN